MKPKGCMIVEFFDETLNRAKEVFDVACQKTGEVVSTEKKRIEISVLKSKNEKDFAVLGKIYFEKLKSGEADPQASELVSRISERKNQISELYSEIQNMKNKAVCKACGAAIEKNSAYCNLCGNKVEE